MTQNTMTRRRGRTLGLTEARIDKRYIIAAHQDRRGREATRRVALVGEQGSERGEHEPYAVERGRGAATLAIS